MKLAVTSKEQDNLYQQQNEQQTRQPANQATRDPRENNNNNSSVQSGQALQVASLSSQSQAKTKTQLSEADQVHEVDQAKIAALKAKLVALYKANDTIPKLIEDDESPEQKISEYYVKLQMVVDDSAGDRQKAYANDKVSGEKIGIEVGNIFSKVDDKHPEAGKVLLLGAPGVGKTTLLHYMAYSWASDAVWQDKFDYVFRVRLKELLDTNWSRNYDVKTELRKDKLACFIHHCLKIQESKDGKFGVNVNEKGARELHEKGATWKKFFIPYLPPN